MLYDKLYDFQLLENGEFFIDKPKGFSLKLLNFENIDKKNSILVCFNAAISNRANKMGPFYSGAGLAERTGLPSILVSDYLVTNSNSLSLGWYLGNYGNITFQQDLANFLDSVSLKLDKKIILVGGSGGGFASLAISSLMKSRCTVIAMNPQTAVSMYYSNAVNDYLANAFSHISYLTPKNCENFLNNLGIVSNVCDSEYNENVEILYLLNKGDKHHIKNHFIPFSKNKKFFPLGDSSLLSHKNLAIYFGEWGGVHVPPQVNIVVEVISLIEQSNSLEIIIRSLENGLNGMNKNSESIFFLTKYNYTLSVKSKFENGIISTDLNLLYRGKIIDIPEYCVFAVYYLDIKGNVVFRTQYSSTMPEVEIDANQNVCQIKVFIKDSFNRKIVGLSNIF